jgi:restriction system protein
VGIFSTLDRWIGGGGAGARVSVPARAQRTNPFSTLTVRWWTWLHDLRVRAKRKHGWRILSADRVLAKLRTFDDPGRKLAYLRKIDSATFEELVLTSLGRRGYVARRNERYTGDGGIDGRVWHAQRGWGATQCKRYGGLIKSSHLVNFAADLQRDGLGFGLFVHTGRTPSTINRAALLAAMPSIEIVSGQALLDLVDGR